MKLSTRPVARLGLALRRRPEGARGEAFLSLYRARQSRKRRGVALIMVLGTLSILTFMLAEFQDSSSAELQSAMASRDQIRAEYAARSAVNLGRLLIASEPTVRMAINMVGLKIQQVPIWKFSQQVLGAFGDEEGASEFSSLSGLSMTETKNLGLEGAGFRMEMVDEDSMISFNTASRADAFSQMRAAQAILSLIGSPQYNDFFSGLDEEGQVKDRQTVCGAIIDWADPDTNYNQCDPKNTTAQGTSGEDSFYQMLKKPYQRKNAAFDSLEELRMVRGITDDFWDTFIQPNPDQPDSRVVTVWSTGKVNINTANAQTLLVLACFLAQPGTVLCEDPLAQQKFLSAVGLAKSMMPGMPIFMGTKDFLAALKGSGPVGTILNTMMQVPPVQVLSDGELEKLLTVKSEVFSIYATGYVKQGKGETRSRIHAVVDMRGAPPPGSPLTMDGASQAAALNGMTQTAASAATSGASGVGAATMNFTNLPRPGGVVLYYRVD